MPVSRGLACGVCGLRLVFFPKLLMNAQPGTPLLMAGRFVYPRTARLLDAAQYRAVFRRGGRAAAGPLRARMSANGLGNGRLGMAIGIKAVGGAVARNRMRRQIRESFRLNQHRLGGLDIVVSVSGRRGDGAGSLWRELSRLWDKVAHTARVHGKWNG